MKLDRLTRSCCVQEKTDLMYAMQNGLEALSNKLIEMGAEFHANLKDKYVALLPCLQEFAGVWWKNKLT